MGLHVHRGQVWLSEKVVTKDYPASGQGSRFSCKRGTPAPNSELRADQGSGLRVGVIFLIVYQATKRLEHLRHTVP